MPGKLCLLFFFLLCWVALFANLFFLGGGYAARMRAGLSLCNRLVATGSFCLALLAGLLFSPSGNTALVVTIFPDGFCFDATAFCHCTARAEQECSRTYRDSQCFDELHNYTFVQRSTFNSATIPVKRSRRLSRTSGELNHTESTPLDRDVHKDFGHYVRGNRLTLWK